MLQVNNWFSVRFRANSRHLHRRAAVQCASSVAFSAAGLRRQRSCRHQLGTLAVVHSTKYDEAEAPVSVKPRQLPIYVTLPRDVITINGVLAYPKALEAGLRALKCIGIDGVVVEVWWGVVEGRRHRQYDWIAYCQLFKILAEIGLQARVMLCFHASDAITLPSWVLDIGMSTPDIFFADRARNYNLSCLTVGIDELPVLHGRSSIECYKDLMHSFHSMFHPLYGILIKEICVGMGPNGELRYPSTPPDRWNYPGIGEFQSYDRYMFSVLQACTLQLERPEYGREAGPHDAGTYCMWPHQTKFFSDAGSWTSDYGTFFLDFYSQNLIAHADRMLEIANDVFGDGDVTISAKLPAMHWWHHSASHAAELTAGINHTSKHDGYVPIIQILKSWDCNVLISACELCTRDEPKAAAADPEALVMYVRTCASTQHLKIGLENTETRFDEAAFAQMEEHCFDRHTSKNIQLSHVSVLTFNRMSDAMFEPGSWHRFKAFIMRLKERLREAHRFTFEDNPSVL